MKTAVSMCVAALALALGSTAQADDYGCQVLLCLSNPAGPMAVSECVPPISRLFSEMAQLHPPPFPTCDLAGATNTAALQYGASGDYCPESMASYECNNQRVCNVRGSINVVIRGTLVRRFWWPAAGFEMVENPPNDALLTPRPPYPPLRCDSSHGPDSANTGGNDSGNDGGGTQGPSGSAQ